MRFALALLATNLKASFALRSAFWMQAAFMAINNLVFFVFWWVLFERFEEIRGWRLEDVAALYGVSAAGFGLAAILAGGIPDLARRIEEGGLDPLLTLPRSVLLQAAAARTRADGWGDVLSGAVLLWLSGSLHGVGWAIAPLGVLISALMFAATGILVHSSAFWLGRVEALARQASEFLITFSVYPPSLFGPGLKVLLFTVIPAGFISYLPAQLLRSFEPGTLALAVGGALGYALLAAWTFGRGLRVYASGSRFGVHE